MPSNALKVSKRSTKAATPKSSVKKVVRKKIVKTPAKPRATRKIPVIRPEKNLIIAPRLENDWEAWQTFNPGVILLDGKIHFVYRAIGPDGISRIGYASSSDGFTLDERLSFPVYEHATGQGVFSIYSYFSGGSFGGAEDPRLVHIEGDDAVYMTYTACDGGLRVGLTSINAKDFLKKKWQWKAPALISPPNEVHKNWLLFPEKINGKYAILHSLKPSIKIEYVDSLDFADDEHIESYHGGPQRKNCWDKWIRGAGAPPLKTKDGWLLLYHAMDDNWGEYKVGAILLDLKDPTKVLRRATAPILTPEGQYENCGYKPGVVYASGAVIKDGTLFIYYGGADNYVCVAHAPLDEFLAALEKEKLPTLRRRTLKTKK